MRKPWITSPGAGSQWNSNPPLPEAPRRHPLPNAPAALRRSVNDLEEIGRSAYVQQQLDRSVTEHAIRRC
eukprot:9132318-Pyramimonas_sp.AAC.2